MSKYDTTSTFPHQIDPPIFFSDIRLEHEVALDAYKELIAEKKYDEAIAYLEAHTEVDAYCSDLFNMLVNRTRAVQKYASGDYTPPAASNPVTMLSSLPSDASGVSGNTVCMSGDSISNLKIVSWADGTWEEISDMINAHKNEEINLYDHWRIGDERTITINGFSYNTLYPSSYATQEVTIVLTGKNVYDLADNSGKCIFTWDMKNCLKETGTMNEPVGNSSTNSGGWKNCPRRTWCNSSFYNALPSAFKSLIPQVKIKSGLGGGSSSGVQETVDYCFLRSLLEIVSSSSFCVPGEGQQLEYYAASTSSRKKSANGSACAWWTRSPGKSNNTGFCRISSDGYASSASSANSISGISVCGCI